MLNNNGERNNTESLYIQYSKYNIYSKLDIRNIKNVEQLHEILRNSPRGAVCLYLNKGLQKLASQTVVILYSQGAPYTSLSQYIEAILYDLVKRVIETRGDTSPQLLGEEAKVSEPLREETKAPIMKEPIIKEAEKPAEEPGENADQKCYFDWCQKPPVKKAIDRRTGKCVYFCPDHYKKARELPEFWEFPEDQDKLEGSFSEGSH